MNGATPPTAAHPRRGQESSARTPVSPPGPDQCTPKPTKPRKSASLAAWTIYLKEVLRWLDRNEIPATIADFCACAGVSRSTLRRRYPEIRDRAYAYAQTTMPSRSRPRPTHAETPSDRLQKAVYRELDRLTHENRDLTQRLAQAAEKVNALAPAAAEAAAHIQQLRACVDRLSFELCRDDPVRGREVLLALQAVRENSSSGLPAMRRTITRILAES